MKKPAPPKDAANTGTATEDLRSIGEIIKPIMRRFQSIKRALDAD